MQFPGKKFQMVADNNGVMSHIGMRRRKRQFFSCAFELKRQLLRLVAISSPTSFYAAGEIGEWKPDAIQEILPVLMPPDTRIQLRGVFKYSALRDSEIEMLI